MNATELQLVAVYGPAVPLKDVCDRYFGLNYREAARYAASGDLPVPTFRLRDSQKAPLLIHASALARYIDEAHGGAQAEWQKAQA